MRFAYCALRATGYGLQSTYEAAANTATWDRATLECGIGVPRVPRAV